MLDKKECDKVARRIINDDAMTMAEKFGLLKELEKFCND